jgi:hypothetical protein
MLATINLRCYSRLTSAVAAKSEVRDGSSKFPG